MSIIKVVSKPYKDLNVLDNIVAYALDVPAESLYKILSIYLYPIKMLKKVIKL